MTGEMGEATPTLLPLGAVLLGAACGLLGLWRWLIR